MKKHIILAAVAALATLTACSNEDEEEPQVPGAEVNFTINNTVTRAVTDANGLTTFKDNDLVYIYSKGLYAQEMNGVDFKVSGTNLTPTSSDVTYRYNGTKGATFTAYHYNNGVITNPITVGNDQSTTGSYQNYDLMTAQVQVNNPSSDAIQFNFKHKFSLVVVDISGIDKLGGSTSIASITINNVKLDATWKSDDNSVTVSGTPTSVKLGKFNDSSNQFWAIVPAQNITSNELIEVVTNTNKVFTYSGTATLSEGKMTKFALTIAGFDEVSATISESAQWGEGSTINQNIEERVLELISTEDGTFTQESVNDITSYTTLDASIAEDKWYIFNNKSNSTTQYFRYEWNEDESNEKSGLSLTTNNVQFWSYHLGYRLNKDIVKKSKNKKFKVEISCCYPDGQSTASINLYVMRINKYTHSDNKTYYPFFEVLSSLNDSDTWYKPTNILNNSKVEYYINFNRIHRCQGNTISGYTAETALETDYDDVVLVITPNSPCTATWDSTNSKWTINTENKIIIKSVSLIEVTD